MLTDLPGGARLLLLLGALMVPPVNGRAAVVEVGAGEVVEIAVSQAAADRVLRIEGPGGVWKMNWRRPPKPETALLAAPGRYAVHAERAPGQGRAATARIDTKRRARRDGDDRRAELESRLARAAQQLASTSVDDARSARALLESALADLAAPEDRGRAAEVRVRLGEALLGAGKVAEAEAELRQALSVFEAEKDRAGIVDAHRCLGLVENWRGNPAGARDEYERALAEAVATGDRTAEALLRGNLGSTYVYLGESQKAIESFRAAVAAARAVGAGREEAWALSNLARAWHAVGHFEHALDSARQALPLMDRARDAKGRLGVLLNTGVILIAMGRAAEAEVVLQKGLALAEAAGDEQTQAALLGRLGEAQAGQGRTAAAVETFGRALAFYEKQRARRAEGLALVGLGLAQQRGGDPAARASLERALERGRTAGDPSIEAAALKGLAGDALVRGDLARARDLSEQSLAVVESLRVQVLAPEFRSSYLASVHDYYEQAIAVLLASHRREPDGGFAAAAFHVSERARARSLLEGLAAGRGLIRGGADPDLLDREVSLRKALERASRQYVRALAGGREAEVAAAEKEIAGLTSRHQELQAELRAKSPRYAALTQPAPLTLGEVQAQILDEDTTLVEFALGESASHAFVIDRRGLRVADLPPRREIDERARAVHARLGRRPARGEPSSSLAPPIERLAAAILAPLAPITTPRIVFVAQGALQYVPFGALPWPGDHVALVARHELLMLPSSSALSVVRRQVQGRARPAGRLAVLADPVFDPGDPRLSGIAPGRSPRVDAVRGARVTSLDHLARLPFTRREAAAIVKAAGTTGVRTALGFEASRELATSREMAGYRILHFATHGLLDDARPELSGLVFSLFDEAGTPRDGFLRLADIYNLDLPADLVVLSACRTGLGKSVRGEGLVGLARAFMYAGAARILASLWTVDDAATAELMAEFYRLLIAEGRSPAAALRGAQLHLQKQPRWRHPYYWAAFTLQGEWQ